MLIKAETVLHTLHLTHACNRFFPIFYMKRNGYLGLPVMIDYYNRKLAMKEMENAEKDPSFVEWIVPDYLTNHVSEFNA